MNSEEQREHWDLKYEQGLTSLTQPDPFLCLSLRAVCASILSQTFPDLNHAIENGLISPGGLSADPELRSLHSDSRFDAWSQRHAKQAAQ
jgi:hypothetical protein